MLYSIGQRFANADEPQQPRRRDILLSSLEERIVFNAELAIDVPAADVSTANVSPVIESNIEQQLAFEGAEGMGRFAQGGRGGDVYHVTNLDDTGEGSLRHGIESMSGPRTIVFDVSGTIFLDSRLTVDDPYLTIAGQTAPGDGITIANHTFQIHNTHDIIVRYIRMRAGDLDIENTSPDTHDTFAIRWSHDVMVDHVSMSWGIDETFATYESNNVTVQWSIISESLSDSYHSKGPHGYGSLNWGGSLSLHHNLIAHHDFRMPKLKDIKAEVVNNVFYDWGRSYPSNLGDTEGTDPSQVNFVNNLYLAGDSADPTLNTKIPFWGRDASEVWASGNLTDANHNGILDPVASDFSLHRTTASTFVSSPFNFSGLVAEPTLDAYQSVLDSSGASLTRDAVDERVVKGVREQGGSIIDSQSDVGGYPVLKSTPVATDSDQDGIPDAWEQANSLDSTDSADGALDGNGNGFTNLEEFLHWVTQPTPQFSLTESTVHSDHGSEYSFSINDLGDSNSDTRFEYQVDWNGDEVIDQRIFAPLGTPISHSFKNGEYQVNVNIVGSGVEYDFDELVSAQDTSSRDGTSDTATSLRSKLTTNNTVKIGEAVAIELTNPAGEVVGIDWNGDGRVDQTVSGGSVIQHFYQQSGAHEIFLFSRRGEQVSSHSIAIESDEPLTIESPPPTPLSLLTID